MALQPTHAPDTANYLISVFDRCVFHNVFLCHFSDGVALGGKTRPHGSCENVGRDLWRQRQRPNGKSPGHAYEFKGNAYTFVGIRKLD